MKLIILTAVLAVCGAAKLEKRFILPGSTRIGGSAHIGGGAHLDGSANIGGFGAFGRGLTNNVPSGGYTNEAQGVVVDAVSPGTRTSGIEPTGLGGPRTAYGSSNSKVGEAAFKVGGAAIKAPLFGLGTAGDIDSQVGSEFGTAAIKGGNTGGLGISVSPGTASISADGSGLGSAALKGGNAGSLGIGVSPGSPSSSIDGSLFGSAAVKGGNSGSFGIGVSPGSPSSSIDGSLFGSAAVKGGNSGSFGIGVSPGSPSSSIDGSLFGSAAVKEGSSGSFGIGVSPGTPSSTIDGSLSGSAAVKAGSSGSFGIGVVPGVASISTDGPGFGSAALTGGNVGGSGIGVSPGVASISTQGSGLSAAPVKEGNAGSFGIGVSPGTGSISTGGFGFGSDTVKGGNAGGFGIGVTPGSALSSTDGSLFGSAAVKGGSSGSFGIGVAPGVDSISTGGSGFGSSAVKGGIDSAQTEHENDKAHALKFANSFSLKKYSYGFETDNGISVGAKGVSTDGIKTNGEYSYKGNDGKDYSVKYTADKNGYRPVGSHLPTPPPIPDEIVESLKQNAKDETAGIVDDGKYDAQKYKHEGQAVSSGGWLKNEAVKTNAAAQSTGSLTGSVGVQGSYGHAQGFEGHTFEDINIGYDLKQQTSQNKQENLNPGVFSVKPQLDYQTTNSQVFDKTESFGVQADNNLKPIGSGSTASAIASTGNDRNGQSSGSPTGVPILGGSLRGSSKDNSAYSSATATGSGSVSAFATTGNIDATVHGTQGSKSELFSFNAASKPYLKLVDTRPKLPYQPSKDVSLSTSSAKVDTLGGSLSNFPAQTSINTDSNSATVGSSKSSLSGYYQGSTSSHYNDITQASISPFPSLLPSLSANFGQIQTPVKDSQSTYDQKLSISGGTKSSAEQGAVYEYSKPTTSIQGHVISNQVHSETDTSRNLFGSQGSLNKPSQTQYSQIKLGSSQPDSKLQTGGNIQQETQQHQGSIYEYNKPAASLTFSKDGVSQVTGSSLSQTQLSAISGSQVGQRPVGDSQTSTTYEKTQFSSSYGSLPSQKPQSALGSVITSSGSSKGESAQNVQFGVKPIGSVQTTGTSFSQTQLGGTSQSAQKPQISTTFGQKPAGVTQTSTTFEKTQFGTLSSSDASKGQYGLSTQFGLKPFGSTLKMGSSFSQSKFSSTSGSQNDQKSQLGVGTISTTFPHVTPISQYGKKPFDAQSSFGSFQQSHHFGSSPGSKFVQQPQTSGITVFGQKPTGISQTVYDYENSQFGSLSSPSLSVKPQSTLRSSFSTNGASKGNSAQTGQFEVKPFGSSQSQLGTFGSSFGQKEQTKGTLSQTSTTFGEKPVGISHTSATSATTQFGSLSGTLFNEKSQINEGGSFSSNDAAKGQSRVTTQFGVKPFGSTLNTGSSLSQIQFSSTSESQKDHKSQLGVGTTSTTFPHVTPISQYGKRPFGTQSTIFVSFQQNQHYAGQKPQTTDSLSQTSTTFGEKPVGVSLTGTTSDKTQFGSLSGTLFNEKSQTSQGGSFSSNDATKSQSGVTTQFGVKPFGSTSSTGSSFSQTQFSSTSESLKDHKSQLGVGTISTTFPYVTPISQYGKRPFGTQSTTFGSFQQNQHYAGQKPQTTDSLSQTSTTFGEKPVGVSLTGTTSDKTQFGSLSGTLFNEKSQTSQGGSFSSYDAAKGQSGVTTQFGVKPFGSTSNTGSSFSQTHFSSTSESQKDHKSQLGVGTISTTFPHVTPISHYGKRPFGTQSTTFGSFQQNQHYAGQKPQTTDSLSQTSTTFGEKPVGVSLTGTTSDKTQFGSLSGTLFNEKSQTSQGGSFSSNDATKSQSGVTTQFGVKPFGSTSSTGSSFSQTQFSSTSESQKDHKSQLGVGTISTTFPHVTPISQYGKRPFGTQSTTFGSFQQNQHYAIQKPQTTGSFSQTSTTSGEKPFGVSLTGTTSDKTQLGSLSGTEKSQTSQGGSFSSNDASKSQSGVTTQFGVKPLGSTLNTGSSFSQTSFDSTSMSLFGQKPQATGLLSLTSSLHGQKPVGALQTSSVYEKTKFESSSGTLVNEKSQASQSSSSSSKDATKGQPGTTTQFGVKPTLSTGSSFSQTQFGITSAFQNDKKSQSGAGTISTVTPQVIPIGQNVQSDGSYTQYTLVGQIHPTGASQTDSGLQTQLDSLWGSSLGEKLQSTQSGSLFSSGTSKVQSELTNKFGSGPFGSFPSIGASSTQSQFDTTLNSKSHEKPTSSQYSQDLLQGTFGGIKTSKYQTSQFSTSGAQPIGSLLSHTVVQQKTQTSSQIGVQKPIGSFDSSYEQTHVTGFQKPAVNQISQQFDHNAQHLQNSNQFTASSSSNRYPSSEIHIYREHNVQDVSGQVVPEPGKVTTGTKTTFSKVEKKVNFQGPGEIFARSRETPKFDIKTGYHY